MTFLSDFSTVATTPSILAEVSSFINQLGEPDQTSCYGVLGVEIDALKETYVPVQQIASTEWYFPVFGLTDSGIAEVAKHCQYLVLADDIKVANFLRQQHIATVSFDDLRAIAQS